MKKIDCFKFILEERKKSYETGDWIHQEHSPSGAGIRTETPIVEIEKCTDGKYKTKSGKLFG